MKINHNIQALNAYRNLAQNMNNTSKSLEKLSSGMRINRAADDAAGLAISEKMRSQIRGLEMAERNGLDAISLIQTAEGALSSTHEILQRMRELSVQAANGTLEDEDRESIQKEINQLTTEINRIGNSTEFNAKKLLNSQISPDARAVEIDGSIPYDPGTTTIDGTSFSLNPKSDLVAGNYNVKIEDVYSNKVTPTGLPGGGVGTVTIDPKDTSLTQGTYGVKVKEEQVKSIVGNPASTSPIADSVIVAPNSTLPDGNVNLQVKRENTVNNFQGNTTGITDVKITSVDPDLSTSDAFTIDVVSKPSNIANGPALPSTYVTGLTIDSNQFQNVGNDYQLKYTDTGSGKYSVTLVDSDGTTAISDPVILDDNIQNYEFYSGGSKIGVSFQTVDDVNTSLNAATADGKYNQFNIDKELVLNENGNRIASEVMTQGTPAGTVTFSAAGIDYEVTHSGFAGIDINESADFGIASAYSYSTDGFSTSTVFNPGDQITLNGGIFVDTSSDEAQYTTPTSSMTIALTTNNSFTAELVDGVGGSTGAMKMVVSDNGSYSFGNPANVSFTTDTLADGTFQFIVGQDTTKNAVLETMGVEIETLEDVNPNSTLSFSNGDLEMDVASLSNGNATFSISGGTIDQSVSFQIGANEGQMLKFGIEDMRSEAVGISSKTADGTMDIKTKEGKTVTVHFTKISGVQNGTESEYAIDVSTAEKAEAAIAAYDQAISKVSEQRSNMGAIQNRLEHTITNLTTANENLTSAESRIRDADMAKEMTTFTKNNILNQAGQAMLAQANQLPQGILQLLK